MTYAIAALSTSCTFGFCSVSSGMNLKSFMRRYPTEAVARRWFEEARWPEGPVCPRCGVVERASALRTRPGQG